MMKAANDPFVHVEKIEGEGFRETRRTTFTADGLAHVDVETEVGGQISYVRHTFNIRALPPVLRRMTGPQHVTFNRRDNG